MRDLVICSSLMLLCFTAPSCMKTDMDIHLLGEGSHEGNMYRDGEVVILSRSAVPDPLRIVILAEGYTEEDMLVGGKYERDANDACMALFDIEPLSRLKWRCETRMVCLVSDERGIGIGEPHNTRFGAYLEKAGGTKICWDCKASRDITDSSLQDVPYSERDDAVCVILCNEDVFAGTCVVSFENGGKPFAASAVSVCRTSPDALSFSKLLWHEVVGHNIGRLLDEYRTYDETITDKEAEIIRILQDSGGWQNVTFDVNHTWGPFQGREGYESVGIYEGAAEYSKGLFRSEPESCMSDNRAYFNAVSRRSIFLRVMGYSDCTAEGDELFLAFDRASGASDTKSVLGESVCRTLNDDLHIIFN